ncbi:Crinkler (CRN) [Phytophthora megakarya]|uniref:Crinkler (CRN) n=1 Tax=Phytophthora megakarya TaxID=4795 RepID=A0A225VZP3_9STRA|nr:Crinkler (CRN) [Phytophthora megakarya]
MKFVNRDDAVQKLVDIHFSLRSWKSGCTRGSPRQIPLMDNLYGMGKTEFGLRYINECRKILTNPNSNLDSEKKAHEGAIPLVDNLYGMGKTEFGLRYINECRKILTNPNSNLDSEKREFRKELSACRTIRIDVYEGAFVGQEPHFNVVNELILKAVLVQLTRTPSNDVLTSKPEDTWKTYVESLAGALGLHVLFIVIDESGRGFEDPRGELASQKLFTEFSAYVLESWCTASKVHFVVMG